MRGCFYVFILCRLQILYSSTLNSRSVRDLAANLYLSYWPPSSQPYQPHLNSDWSALASQWRGGCELWPRGLSSTSAVQSALASRTERHSEISSCLYFGQIFRPIQILCMTSVRLDWSYSSLLLVSPVIVTVVTRGWEGWWAAQVDKTTCAYVVNCNVLLVCTQSELWNIDVKISSLQHINVQFNQVETIFIIHHMKIPGSW